MWWHDLLWGFWNGATGWLVLIGHVIGVWEGQPVYDGVRTGNWYDFGFLVGAGSPLFGSLRARNRRSSRSQNTADQ